MKLCPRCGFAMQDHNRFCQNCGAEDIYTPIDPEIYIPPVKKKNPILIILLVILGMAIASTCGFFAYNFITTGTFFVFPWKNSVTPTPTPQPIEATPTPQPTGATPTPVVKSTTPDADHVKFNHLTDNAKESAEIIGCASDGSEVWKYVTGSYDMAQCDRVQEIGTYQDNYIFVEDGSVRAFDYKTGQMSWANSKYQGNVAAHQIDSDGKLYLCGYLGPDLMVLNANDGTTIKRIDQIQAGYVRPYRLSLDGDDILFEYEEGGKLRVNKQTFQPEGQSAVQASPIQMSNIVNAVASSWLNEPEWGLQHTAWCLLDNRTDLAWTEDNPGDGVGEYVELYFNEKHTVSGINIWAGHHISQDLYNKNSRPKGLRVTLDDGSSMDINLADEMKMQTIPFSKPVVTSSIRLTILSVYPGWKYSDVCISEVQLY